MYQRRICMKIRERVNLAAGIIFTLATGTLLHFTYEWSGEKLLVGAFSAARDRVRCRV